MIYNNPQPVWLDAGGNQTLTVYQPGKYFIVDMLPYMDYEQQALLKAIYDVVRPMEDGKLPFPLRMYLSPLMASKIVAQRRSMVVDDVFEQKLLRDMDIYDGREHFVGHWYTEGKTKRMEIIYTSSVPDELIIFRY